MLAACDEIGEALQLKYSSGIAGGQESFHDGLVNEEEAENRKLIEEKGELMLDFKPPRWKLADVLAKGVQDVKQPLR